MTTSRAWRSDRKISTGSPERTNINSKTVQSSKP
jgi:hypothetical protein